MAEYKVLTAQIHCLQAFGFGEVTCIHGTATVGNPLIFTASAGGCLFESTAEKWMLTAASGYVYPYCPPGVTVPATSSTTGGNGCNVPLNVKMITALSGGPMTAAARIYCGASSAEITADTNIIAVRNVDTDLIYLASGGVIKSSDGTNTATVTVAGGWARDIVLDIFVRTNSAGTQFQIGYLKPTETAITWGDLATYKGTFTPGTYKRTALNGVPPFWIHGDFIDKRSLTDAEAIRRFGYTT